MKSILLLLIICISFSLQAQVQLVFSKVDSSKTIIVKMKDLVRFSYNGYMQQAQEIEGRVTALNDTLITLSPRRKLLQQSASAQTIRPTPPPPSQQRPHPSEWRSARCAMPTAWAAGCGTAHPASCRWCGHRRRR